MEIQECACCGKPYIFDAPHMLLTGLTGYYLCAVCAANLTVKALNKQPRTQEVNLDGREEM